MPTLTPGDGQDILDAFKRATEQRDPDAGTSLFSEHAEWRPDPFEDPITGANAIREHWNLLAATQVNVEFDPERTWVFENAVLSSWHGATTDRSTGRRTRLRGFLTLEVDDERKIQRFRQWEVMRVVGQDSTVKLSQEGPGGR